MNILWITNTLFPDVCIELGIGIPHIGGWMPAAAEALLNKDATLKLGVASLYDGIDLKVLVIKNITYFLIPRSQSAPIYDNKLEYYWQQVRELFKADIVHIHGSEFPHGLAYINIFPEDNIVISIQGLISVYERYYYGGISWKALLANITFRDLFKRDTIFSQRNAMFNRGKFEQKMIKSVRHIIGRTNWDRAQSWAINSTIQYHLNNETLRSEFYKNKWDFNNCEKYTVFLSQAHYPIKGMQQLIFALPLIIKHFPETKVYVAGHDFVNKNSLRLSGFGRFIKNLIQKNGLEQYIIFTGILSEKEIVQRFLASNVFVCPSSIENSPNSIGEAQLLGVPCIGSFVGGMADMIEDGESGLLYRFEEVEMLAHAICRIFSDESLAQRISANSRAIASLRHHKELNSGKLIEIYNTICKDTFR